MSLVIWDESKGIDGQCLKSLESRGGTKIESHFLVVPKQLALTIVLNKNGKIGWWTLGKSLKSPNR